MNNKPTILLFIVAILFMLHACKKDHEMHHEPVISIISPSQGQELNEHDTVRIRISLSSEDDLHEYLVNIRNVTENKEAFNYNGHSHGKAADVDLFFLPDVSKDAEMLLTVTILDHNGVKSSRSITFSIKNTVAASRPRITITSPAQAEYHDGDLVQLRGTVMHDRFLKEVSIMLTKNGSAVLEFFPDVSGTKEYAFDTSYTVTSDSHAGYVLTVTAKDENDLTETKSFSFDVHH